MADISIVINPAETISANILPPNSISIGTADSYPPHASSHAPGGYDSLSSYYVATGDLTGYVNKSQTGYLSGTFYPYSANPAGYVQGAVVRPSNTGNFVDKASAVLITGDQNISGVKTFYSRPSVSGIGLQTTGEYATFNLWDEFSGELYPYPKNDLNRSYNTLKRAENNSGPSGATIWFNIPQWTGAKPSSTGVSSFYNTGFWARDYDWSCVSFKGSRTNSGNASVPLTLISPRHAMGVNHIGDGPGAKCAFVSNKETGYTWEATIASTTNLSGDVRLYTFTSDAPSEIRPASIIGSPPKSIWEYGTLNFTRVLTVQDSTVLFDRLGNIASGAGFQSGSLIISHLPDYSSRYTGIHKNGDSASPVFFPLQDGRLVFIGAASTVSTVGFIGDPVIRSGISAVITGHTVDTWNVPAVQTSGLMPVSGQFSRIGSISNKWREVYAENIHADNLYGNLGEYDLYPYNEYLYGGSVVVASDLHGLTFNTHYVGTSNTINFSGIYSETFWTRFVIPNSGASVNFSSSGPTLLMPNGSGFSGVGYVIEVRGVGDNKLLIQPISEPPSVAGSTGYLTGYVNKTETGNFYPRSNPSGYITPGQTGNFITTSQTGQFVSTGSTGSFVTGSVVRPSETGAFLTTGQTGVFITSSQTGQFVSTGSTGSFVTGSVVRPSETGNFITTFQTGQFVSTGSTGNFVTGSVVRPSETGSFITSSQTGQFVSTGATGSFVVSSQTGAFLTTGAADSRYALQSATGAFVTTGQTGQFVTGSVVRPSETGIFITTGQTGSFITASQTGAFYPNSNPSGYITGVDLSSYATTSYVTGVSGYLQYQISNFSGSSSTGSYVSLTGNETISGIKNFISRPTVNTTGVLISGDAVDTIHLYGKNSESFTLNKGQPVYIGGANGANPLIKRSSNTGESDSSKTIGLLAQDLNSNDFGYIVSEGILEGFNTSAATAGDPMWLGATGDILFGTGNKPYGNNHLVYLGVVLRSQSSNGKVYVKPQNGFEIEELHRVYAKNASTNDTLMYNSGSGSWFARQITTGDVSGISSYALAANTGSFVTSNATGAFLTTGAADSRYYNISNGQSISGFATTGFNDAVTGMTITGDATKTITLFQRGGSTVSSSFTDNTGTGGGGGGASDTPISLISSIWS